MAEGVRIRHRTVRNATVVIRDLSKRAPIKPGRPWPGCGLCRLPSPGHEGFQTRHITVDENGEATVSEPYWYELEKFIDHGGFEAISTHRNPPPIRIRMGARPRREGLVLPVQDLEKTR